MNVSQDLSIIELILNASLVVKLAKSDPTVTVYQNALASTLTNMGLLLKGEGKRAEDREKAAHHRDCVGVEDFTSGKCTRARAVRRSVGEWKAGASAAADQNARAQALEFAAQEQLLVSVVAPLPQRRHASLVGDDLNRRAPTPVRWPARRSA